MQFLRVGLAVSLFAPLFGPSVASAQDEELKALKGEWRVVWVVEKGVKKKPDFYSNDSYIFFPKMGKFKWYVPADSDWVEGTFTIDPGKNPKAMDKTWGQDGKPWKFIYKIQGDELWLAHGAQDQRPTSFSDRNISVTIYKRK
jgi:uncharacterized protein (TIGR03067 family)